MIDTSPNHKHTYDEHGNMTCCTLEEKIYAKADQKIEDHDHGDHADHDSNWKTYLPAIISFVLLLIGIYFDNFLKPTLSKGCAFVFLNSRQVLDLA